MDNQKIFNSNHERVMDQIEQSGQFCETGKKAVKLHLMGLSTEEIAKTLNQDEEMIRDTIKKMSTIVK